MRKILDRFFPLGTKRRNFLFHMKQRCRNLLYRFKRKRNPNSADYIQGNGKIYDKYQNTWLPCHELKSIHKKIALHLHLYYKDLLEEMITYLSNMPFSFDLYVSTVDEKDNDYIVKRLKTISKVQEVEVKVTKNSGRDYGPMMVAFGKKLEKYDYVGHIHTKKSLRMGASQDDWRHHLLDGVLGSESLIRKIFYLFEQEQIGIFFPDSINTAPYWANTWMGVKNLGAKICGELGIPFQDVYQDFSVGSMFWVRTEAAKEIFHKKWTWEEFGEERGLNDGTLAYVFERLFVLDSNKNGYDFICYQKEKNIFYKNYSERNRLDYYVKTKETLYQKLKEYDVISFDIFDTLITRMVVSPSDIFELLHLEVSPSLLKGDSFPTARRKAELSIGEKIKPEDSNLDQIYEELAKIYSLDKKEAEKLKKRELELEKKFLIPRQDMLSLFNELKEDGKEIILISDMYLSKKQLITILKNCGYTGYRELYVSSETNMRKDRGDIWPWIKEKYAGKRFIHIGDNEESDIHKLWDFDVENEHIMQGKHLFSHTAYGYMLRNANLSDNIVDSILYGLIINKKWFNSPFKLSHSKGDYAIESLEEFGYVIVGPILLTFLLWVIQESKEDKREVLLFLAREGYYLYRLFELLAPNVDFNPKRGIYFQTSRRCVSVANIHTEEDIKQLLDIEFYGNMKDFLFSRFGVEYEDKNFAIILCDDNPSNNRNEVEKAIEKYIPKILKRAEKERKSYLKYIEKVIGKDYSKLCVVDLGYSGTTQLYLAKLLNAKISGKYVVVKNKPKPLSIGCKVQSCFNELENDNNHILYKNALFLECFLTAPNGQLMYFDEKTKPVFVDEKHIHEKFEFLNQIYQGVEELFKDMINLAGKELMNQEINKDYLLKMYQAFLLESDHFIEENKTIFTFEDSYCRSEEIVIEKQS